MASCSDGVPSYELAVVVDDLTMGVTEVRGDLPHPYFYLDVNI